MTHCATRTSNFCATWSQLLFLKATIRDNHGNTAHILITSLSSNKTPFSENGNDKTGSCCMLSAIVVEDSDLRQFLQWMHPPHVCSHTQMHFCPFVHTRRKIPLRVCKQRHCLHNHAVMYLCKSEGGSALSIMCEICYTESRLTSVLIYAWLQNTLWQEQVVIFRTSKLCRKLVVMMIKTCLLKKI